MNSTLISGIGDKTFLKAAITPRPGITASFHCGSTGSCVGRVSTAKRRRPGNFLGIVAFLAALAPAPLLALDPAKRISQYAHDTWPGREFPEVSTVQAIVRDRSGYLWLGTRNGLVRFDGVRFSVFDRKRFPKFENDRVNTLLETRDGSLWVGTERGPYRLTQGRILPLDGLGRAPAVLAHVPEQSSPQGVAVHAFAERSDGTFWIATGRGNYLMRDGVVERRDSLRMREVLETRDGAFWMGTYDNGLIVWRGREERSFTTRDGLPADSILALIPSRQGGVWVGTRSRGVARVTDRVVESYSAAEGLASNDIHSLCEDRDGSLWVGTERGLSRVRDGRVDSFRSIDGLTGDVVNALFEDAEGSLWVGTRAGLDRFKDGAFITYGKAEGLPSENLAAVIEDRQGNVWVTTFGGGLARLHDGKVQTFPVERDSGRSYLHALFEARDGSLWASTELGGLLQIRDGRARALPLDWSPLSYSSVFSIAEDDTGLFLTSRTGALFRVDGRSARPFGPPPPSTPDASPIYMIRPDPQGGFRLASERGLLRLSGEQLSVVLTTREGLPTNTVYSFHEDAAGDLWLGTHDGLALCRRGRCRAIGAEQGLAKQQVYSVLEDGQANLWLRANSGILRVAKRALLDVVEGRARTVEPVVYDTSDGLRGVDYFGPRDPAAVKGRDGRLWFATASGLSVVDPTRLVAAGPPPPVRIEQILVDGRELSAADGLELPAGSDRVEIRYSALRLLHPRKIRFRFRLDPMGVWVEAGTERVAHFTNLHPGTYRFQVRASNEDGVWARDAQQLTFRLLPLWYQTLAFRLSLALGAGLLVAAGVWLRMAQLRGQQQHLAREVAARTRELSAEVGERRRAEEEVRRLNEALEARVEERTAALAQTNRALDESNKALADDIERRQRAEEELEAEKERLAVTLRSIADGVISVDVEGRVTLLNRAAEELTGWRLTEARGRPLEAVFPIVDAATREPVLDIVSRVISSGGTAPVPAHLVLLACDGREIVVAERFAPIRDRDSRIVGIAIVFRDVTEQLRAQQQLQRTEKLEALGILAGGIAHDFNNILTGIFGHIELALQRSSDQALVERNLSRAHQVIGKARGLAAQLLTFTRAGEPVTKSVALDGLLRDSARFVLSGSSVSAQLELPPDLWPCQVDPRQIEQVVDNLLLNARQAMPEGGVVQISAENVRVEAGSGLPLAPGAYVRLLVRDHGIGVPKNLLSRVFDPFFTTKATGTGLGLATSYSIVKKHGGHIELDSEVGIGSTFTLYLPVAGEAPNVVERTVPIKTPASGRVLVMDDDDVVREIAAEMLTGLGYEVDVVRNGVEAISHYEAAHTAGRPFTVVILDLTIPGGTGGVGTLARLRRIAPQVKAIASSGYASDPVMARPEQSGFAGTLTKPYTFEELAEVLHRVLGSPAGAK